MPPVATLSETILKGVAGISNTYVVWDCRMHCVMEVWQTVRYFNSVYVCVQTMQVLSNIMCVGTV